MICWTVCKHYQKCDKVALKENKWKYLASKYQQVTALLKKKLCADIKCYIQSRDLSELYMDDVVLCGIDSVRIGF